MKEGPPLTAGQLLVAIGQDLYTRPYPGYRWGNRAEQGETLILTFFFSRTTLLCPASGVCFLAGGGVGKGNIHAIQNFPGQGSNLYHSYNQSHSSDKARCVTH